MKISIVTISFNQGSYLAEAIESVLNQGVDIEYIVVDPGSTDNSREIIKRYESRIDKLILEKDKGPADGLNKGFAHATGDIFGYLNADDVLLPGVLKEVVNYFKQSPETQVLSGHGYILNEKSEKLYKVFSNKLNSSVFVKERFTAGYSMLVQQSTFFRKEIFQKTGGFDTDYRIMWDGALAVDFMNLNATFKVVHKYWSGFRIYSNSLTGSGQHNDNRALDTYRKMQRRAGLSEIPAWKYPYLRFVGWLLEPSLLFRRIIDGFQNRRRLNIVVPVPDNKK